MKSLFLLGITISAVMVSCCLSTKNFDKREPNMGTQNLKDNVYNVTVVCCRLLVPSLKTDSVTCNSDSTDSMDLV